jgi:hypothetical protein
MTPLSLSRNRDKNVSTCSRIETINRSASGFRCGNRSGCAAKSDQMRRKPVNAGDLDNRIQESARFPGAFLSMLIVGG